MKPYKKWFIVDADDRDNPRALSHLVGELPFSLEGHPFFEINEVRYNIIEISEPYYEDGEKERAQKLIKLLREERKSMDDLTRLISGIDEQIKDIHYWEYRDIIGKKVVE